VAMGVSVLHHLFSHWADAGIGSSDSLCFALVFFALFMGRRKGGCGGFAVRGSRFVVRGSRTWSLTLSYFVQMFVWRTGKCAGLGLAKLDVGGNSDWDFLAFWDSVVQYTYFDMIIFYRHKGRPSMWECVPIGVSLGY
jgi:hypothetical protein